MNCAAVFYNLLIVCLCHHSFDSDLKGDGCNATRWGPNNEIIVMDKIAIVKPYKADCVLPYSAKDKKVLDGNLPGTKLDFVVKMVSYIGYIYFHLTFVLILAD